ncbi:hypothetical protein ACJRO7_029863 [Eucalyptus globulus]|uniref:Uncharacterized protein n=1 Tax=Eucalyptus globulus TaxID=34317 RepID=A0ABD3JC99_EUCGL
MCLIKHYVSTIWVDEGPGQLIPHWFLAWFIQEGNLLIGPLRGFDGPPGRGPEDADWDPMELDSLDGAVVNPGPAPLEINLNTSDYDLTESESDGSE